MHKRLSHYLILAALVAAIGILVSCNVSQQIPNVPPGTPAAAFPLSNSQTNESPVSCPVETCAHSRPQPIGQPDGWNLVFYDEFNGTSLDSRNWTTCYWWSAEGCTNASNQNMQWYQSRQINVAGGSLRIRADERSVVGDEGEVFPYTSGIVTTGRDNGNTNQRPRFAFQYGYVEMRAKVPTGAGLWPAFWMLPVSHESRPEIDIMEILGHDPHAMHMYLHYLDEDGGVDRSGGEWRGPDFSEDWHTFAVHWEPTRITWYVDGVERHREDNPARIPAQPMYLLANLAVGGEWPGPPSAETEFPAFYDIDYIRVWKAQDAIHPGDTWRYFKGTNEPPEGWHTLEFDDTAWPVGPSGFGYGDRNDATVLFDMPGNYESVYIRRSFLIEDPDRLEALTLYVDYDDGFVAYINGIEVARSNVSGTPPSPHTRADGEHEASHGMGPIESFDLTDFSHLLVPGANVIALQGHNVSADSSDFALIPALIPTKQSAGPSESGPASPALEPSPAAVRP